MPDLDSSDGPATAIPGEKKPGGVDGEDGKDLVNAIKTFCRTYSRPFNPVSSHPRPFSASEISNQAFAEGLSVWRGRRKEEGTIFTSPQEASASDDTFYLRKNLTIVGDASYKVYSDKKSYEYVRDDDPQFLVVPAPSGVDEASRKEKQDMLLGALTWDGSRDLTAEWRDIESDAALSGYYFV
ncbi:uncharacterized protein I303_103963 [Kwoniella dejecticola CBS 10117]|uniref:Uncharacterized protein n=1 Tax=Kwoniella dejecticola CBS 10117 TaxID=1296121 RepID=A0A1A6A868_9TREE|nr:uncharacterized protein I303_03981 [Kwoniella dejecticola CBS 10117]OBR86259.1 hypothetical protein I303_03981 [Kwoniella dejecticola CBS 10117]